MFGVPWRVERCARVQLKWARRVVRPVLYSGTARWCPVCGRSSRRFGPYGEPRRLDAECVHCGALERHRFVWLYLTRKTDLFDGRPKQMLHVAPERCFEPRLRERLGGSYVTADLLDPTALVKMDITDIQYPDGWFDVIYCSHVLEHVQDDRRAMREFRRVLKADGWAILLVPITAGATVEDPSIVDPAERNRLFGQEDHVRRYGQDFEDRLREAGFAVTTTRVADLREDVARMGLGSETDAIYHCTRSRP